ncbi:hypothetical protein RZS08_42080, partial [Arthrospira platensis SPKY1]|nr:hypothetical protein [Arthrospira platensis SPKY1]
MPVSLLSKIRRLFWGDGGSGPRLGELEWTRVMTPLFSGSYRPEDTIFLLKPIALERVDVATKER